MFGFWSQQQKKKYLCRIIIIIFFLYLSFLQMFILFEVHAFQNNSLGPLQVFFYDTAKVDKEGQMFRKEKKVGKLFSEKLTEKIKIEMIELPAGEFLMGSSKKEQEQYYEDFEFPKHKVKVKKFFMSKFEITQEQWQFVSTLPKINIDLLNNPSFFRKENDDLNVVVTLKRYSLENFPVEQISWLEATEFCQRLSIFAKKNYTLPSEAEWEYACRAGTSTPFAFGESVNDQVVNYYSITARQTVGGLRPVGEGRVANRFGLYDMEGNVSEWCLDSWFPNYYEVPTDARARITANDEKLKVVRGGDWRSGLYQTRSAYRRSHNAENKYSTVGFRIVVHEMP
jgi:formylglycine-generating enzyme required for sulfatase activity